MQRESYQKLPNFFCPKIKHSTEMISNEPFEEIKCN